ncbi:MAG TPA: GNAT family N-acetyltransferase [Candidatus Limnocylindrales bacterium]|nr:GNAT family N-acetyltransferase [Candidatus Limnocylindrales bacterium]
MNQPATPSPDIVVADNPAEGRYEIRVDGDLAGVAEYRDRGGRRIFVHTVIDDAFAGRGLGNRLAAGALDDAIDRGLPIVPRCPFIRAYLERHPEYQARIKDGQGSA